MKKALSFVLVLSLVLSLGTISALASQKVEISFWKQLFEEFDQEWTRTMVDEFNAQSQTVQVNLEFVDGGALTERMTAARDASLAYLIEHGLAAVGDHGGDDEGDDEADPGAAAQQ